MTALQARFDSLPPAQRGQTAEQMREVSEVARLASELRGRMIGLYNEIVGWAAPLTADQRSQLAYYREFMTRLEPRMARCCANVVEARAIFALIRPARTPPCGARSVPSST